MEDVERERERKDRSDAACTRYKGMQGEAEWRDDGGRGGRVVKRWVLQEAAWWRQSRARGWENGEGSRHKVGAPLYRRPRLWETLSSTLLPCSLSILFFSSAPLLPSFLPSSPLRWNFISSLTGPPTPLFLLIPSLFDRGFLLLLLFFLFYRCSIYDFIFRFTIVLLTIQFLAYFPSNLRKKNLISLGHLLLPSPLSIIVRL